MKTMQVKNTPSVCPIVSSGRESNPLTPPQARTATISARCGAPEQPVQQLRWLQGISRGGIGSDGMPK